MINKKNKKNELERFISNNIKILNLKPIDSIDVIDFPRLELNYIKTYVTLGSYQLSENILNDNGHKILYAEVQSRHSQSTKYQIFIRYSPNKDGTSLAWCCTCMTGSRTVGSCTHVAMLLSWLWKIYRRYTYAWIHAK